MFEDSTFESAGRIRTGSRRWMIASFAFYASIVLACVMIPLMFPEALPILVIPIAANPGYPHRGLLRAGAAFQSANSQVRAGSRASRTAYTHLDNNNTDRDSQIHSHAQRAGASN
jgi:hypothetical protein